MRGSTCSMLCVSLGGALAGRTIPLAHAVAFVEAVDRALVLLDGRRAVARVAAEATEDGAVEIWPLGILEGGRDHWGQVVGEELVECLGQAGRLVGLQVGHVRNAHLREWVSECCEVRCCE